MFGRNKKSQPPLRDDIAAAYQGQFLNPMLKKTARRLESKLMNDERVIAISECQLDKRDGLLVHTNYRLLFTVESIAGNVSEAVALERISAVRHETKRSAMASSGHMTVQTPNRELRFDYVGEPFAARLQAVTG